MNPKILNREFKHPEDGWYQIEAKGEHPNRGAGIVQVIDDQAVDAIVKRFNQDAVKPDFAGMLVDHEHFKHDQDKETIAYGWLMKLQNRHDGVYGQVKWTSTGKPAVDGGDYRYFSSEYDPQDFVVLNRDGKTTRARPLRLDGLTLTNSPNNKGGRPITNRGSDDETISQGTVPGGTQNEKTKMKSIAMKLALSADASEEAVLAEMAKVINRATGAEAQVTELTARIAGLESANKQMATDLVEAELAEHGVSDEKVLNRVRPVLLGLKKREERLAFLGDVLPKKQGTAGAGAVLNRSQAKAPAAAGGAAAVDGEEAAAKAQKIMNRARELQGASQRGWDSCWQQAQAENK